MTTREARLPLRMRIIGLVLLALGLSTFVWSPAINNAPLTQSGDGQYFHRIMEIVKVTVVRYHEWPLWNPFECGGVPLWDNPEMPAASPLAYLTIPFTGTHTMWIWYIVHSAFGFIAMWLFARHEIKLTRPATFAAACLWAFGVGHVTQYAGGHATLCNFYLFPAALLLWRRAEEKVDYAVGLGMLFAWIFLEGGAYPLVHTSLLIAFETVIRLLTKRSLGSALRIVRAFGIVSVVAFLLAGVRLLPVFDQVTRHKRDLAVETDALQWQTFVSMFFHREHSWGVPGQTYVWPEFASYFGWITMSLAALGILIAAWEVPWFFAVGVFAFLLMTGHSSPHAPWHVLKEHVFPFSAMRVPSRFRLYVACFIAIFVGLAADRLAQRLRAIGFGRGTVEITRVVVLSLALVGAGDVMSVASLTVGQKYTASPETKVVPSTRLYFEGPGLAPFLDQPRQNRGRLACADSWTFTEGAPVWTGDVPQARAIDSKATVEVANRTPNTFTIEVDVREPARILVNTPYEKGWRTTVGTTADVSKQLAIDLPPGRHRIKVYYWPRGLSAGIVLSILGVVLCVAWFTRDRIREALARRREGRRDRRA